MTTTILKRTVKQSSDDNENVSQHNGVGLVGLHTGSSRGRLELFQAFGFLIDGVAGGISLLLGLLQIGNHKLNQNRKIA